MKAKLRQALINTLRNGWVEDVHTVYFTNLSLFPAKWTVGDLARGTDEYHAAAAKGQTEFSTTVHELLNVYGRGPDNMEPIIDYLTERLAYMYENSPEPFETTLNHHLVLASLSESSKEGKISIF